MRRTRWSVDRATCGLRPAAAALLVGLATVVLTGCERSARTVAKRNYNVLLVTLDTTRADYLGCYDPQRVGDTPNLDALAADAVQFMTCFAASAVTPPSHASILTGLYPFQHGVRVIYAKSGYRLGEDVPYLPAVLREAGWKTAAFLSSFTVSEFYGFERAFETFDNGLTQMVDEVLRKADDGVYEWMLPAHQRRSDKTTDAALEWLEETGASRPFCLWVHYWDPHDCFPEIPETAPPREFYLPFVRRSPDQTEVGTARAIYAAEVAYLDRQFGRLIENLKSTGRYEDTIIIVVADHGEGLGEHDWWRHTLLYEEQIHVPFIMRVPGWPTGRRISSLVRTIDICPTILDALGVERPGSLGGVTLRGLVHGETEPPRTAYADALSRFDANSRVALWRPKDGNLYCATDGTWKLIWRFDCPADSELYNIVEDPDELANLLEQARPQARRLRRVLEDLRPFRTEPFPPAGLPEDEGALRALRSLGYVGGSPTSGPVSGQPRRASTGADPNRDVGEGP